MLAVLQEKNSLSGTVHRLSASLQSIQLFLADLGNMEYLPTREGHKQAMQLLQRIMESMAAQVGDVLGGKQRCGLWLHADGELILIKGSAGFPHSYFIGEGRRLPVNDSVAGEAFLLQQQQYHEDVRSHDKWKRHHKSQSNYTSIMTVPLWTAGKPIGVITIDSQTPLDENAMLIAGTYARLLEPTFDQVVLALGNQGASSGLQ